ncbi:MAG TPA: Ig-like domain-containing protein [Flavobacteriales bacterium]|nr:Ig-like domain-containing protein [Flavobacteriales bacterium]
MKAKTLPYLLSAAIVLLALNFQACKKPGDTIGIVTVVDNNGNLISGANVKLLGVDTDGNPGGRIDVDETTGSDGKATFNFNEYYKRGQAGFTVLDVIASKDTLGGRTIIKIEEEKTSDCIVTIEDQ